MTTLTGAVTSFRGTGKSPAKKRGGKAPLFALMTAGAGAAALAKRRANQREATPPDATPPESPPAAPPPPEPPQTA